MDKANLFVLSSSDKYVKLLRDEFRSNEDISKEIRICPWTSKLPPKADVFEVITKLLSKLEETPKYACMTETISIENKTFIDKLINYNSKGKFILILDDPIKNLIHEAEKKDLDVYEFINNNDNIEKNFYYEHLKYILQFIHIKNVHIVIGELLISNFDEEINHIMKFLNINLKLKIPANISDYKYVENYVLDNKTKNKLINIFDNKNKKLEVELNKIIKNFTKTWDYHVNEISLPWYSIDDIETEIEEVKTSSRKASMAWIPIKSIPVKKEKVTKKEDKYRMVNTMTWQLT